MRCMRCMHDAVIQLYSYTAIQWYSDIHAVIRWYDDTLMRWYIDAAIQWCTVIQRCADAAMRCMIQCMIQRYTAIQWYSTWYTCSDTLIRTSMRAWGDVKLIQRAHACIYIYTHSVRERGYYNYCMHGFSPLKRRNKVNRTQLIQDKRVRLYSYSYIYYTYIYIIFYFIFYWSAS